MKRFLKRNRHLLVSLVAIVLLVLNLYLAKALEEFGSPLLFGLAVSFEIFLLCLFSYGLIRSLVVPETILKSIVRSLLYGLAANEYVIKAAKSKSPLIVWLKNRLKRNNPYGLRLTITVLLVLFLSISFIGVLNGVVSRGSFTQTDLRVLNLMPYIRTPTQTTFFRFITFLANTVTIGIFVAVIAGILWRKNKRPLSILVLIVTGGEESITYVLKHLVKRLRPDISLRLISEDSYSFPSGHVVRATVLFGLLAYFIHKSLHSSLARLLTIAVYILTVFTIALSRIYFGVHYPSDVWGSFLLGSALLSLIIGALEINNRFRVFNNFPKINNFGRRILAIPLALIVFSIVLAPFFIRTLQISKMPGYRKLPAINSVAIKRLPVYSENMSGGRMEPISFIYVGYEDQLKNAFINHGWYKADSSTLGNTLRALAIGFQGKQYATAPVTPSFLNTKPEDLSFQQPTISNTLRQRHHTRLWRTNYALPDGRPLWEATASFDEGIEFAGTAKLPTHRINPNIDAERTYIVNSLGLKDVSYLQVVNPQIGKNASGDYFFTDGRAAIVNLK